jgi:DNA-binding transcriptional MerR regulator
MEYTVKKLAQISGVTTRTLRYYDEVGLLEPARVSSNGYRIYGNAEVDSLQQILFFRELGLGIDDIKQLLTSPEFDREKALQNHLIALRQKKAQIELLIENVSKTLCTLRGEIIMNDQEKFCGFKKHLIDENERTYGAEVREKYGNAAMDNSNAKIMGMSETQYTQSEQLRLEINDTLQAAMATGDPAGELAQKACELHKKWLCIFLSEGTYTKQMHRNFGIMYVSDERFRTYYDSVAEGCAEFLRKSLNIYCSN